VGVQKAIKNSPGRSLYALEERLIKQFNAILEREEILWFQKARCNWIQFGDRNTGYFHATTIAKRRKSKITSLLNDSNTWCEDDTKLKELAQNFFKGIYQDTNPTTDPAQSLNFPRGSRLSEAQLLAVLRPINQEEIRKTIFSMDPYKAPGCDGLPAKFYQANWSIVGNKVCDFILTAFRDGFFDRKINETLICIIDEYGNVLIFAALKLQFQLSFIRICINFVGNLN